MLSYTLVVDAICRHSHSPEQRYGLQGYVHNEARKSWRLIFGGSVVVCAWLNEESCA